MRKEEFMIKYVLARAAMVSASIDIEEVVKDAVLAWDKIMKECRQCV